MACEASASNPSNEKTNPYARLCRLLVDIGTQVLRDKFDAIHAPSNLHIVLAGNTTLLQSLKARKIINPTQWGKLFPAIPSSVSSATFDITLLMILLRNVCGLVSPPSGWDTLPPETDESFEADIARIKYYRNIVFAHPDHASVDNPTFSGHWKSISDSLVRLGGVKYRAAIDLLKTESMDPESEEHYKDLLSQWKKDEDNVKDKLANIETKITNVEKKVDDFVASSGASKQETILEGTRISFDELLDTSLMGKEEHHGNKPLAYYCENCQICISEKCGQTRHANHIKVDIHKAAEEHKASIEKIIKEMKKGIADRERHLEKVKELRRKSREKIVTARNRALTSIEELKRVLKEHERAIRTELEGIEDTEQRGYIAQLNHLQHPITQLKTHVEYCETILRENKSVEILRAQQNVIEGCKGLLGGEEMNIYKPLCVRYEINEEGVDKVRGAVLGRVVKTRFTDPLLSVVEGEGLHEAEVGRESSFTIMTNDSDGKRCYDEDDKIAVKIEPCSGGVLDSKIEQSNAGEYRVLYTPNSAGQHDVMIEVNGQLLTGSPWPVQVSPHLYQPTFSFGLQGTGLGQFYGPSDIAINDKTGDIAVADCNNNRVQIFNSDGIYMKQIGANELIKPTSVAFTRSDDLLVVASDKIFCFDGSGQFVKNITNEHLNKPFRLTISRDGRMIVCDVEDQKIKVLSSNGAQLLQTISAPDCCHPPWFAVCDRDVFVVSYYWANCLRVFSKEGEVLCTISVRGPAGLVIDNYGNLVICETVDRYNGKLQVKTLDGHFVSTIERPQFPWSVAMSTNGQLFVTDVEKHCVHVFR